MGVLGRGTNLLRGIVDRRRREREMKAGRWVDDLAGDVRYALRYFARTPLLTLTIVLTLMLGIGTNSALLAVLDGLTTRPAPGVPDDPSLVFLTRSFTFRGELRAAEGGISYREIADYRRLPVFKDVAGWTSTTNAIVATGADEASVTTAYVHFVTPNYFDVAGIPLAMGPGFVHRTFDAPAEPELTVVLSHGFWRDRFASAPDVVGRRIRINDRQVTVVGVAPARFNGISRSSAVRKMWMPLSARSLVDAEAGALQQSQYVRGIFQAFARLAPGASIATAQPAVAVVAANAAAQVPRQRGEREYQTDVRAIWDDLSTNMSSSELVIGSLIFGSVGVLILLICCTNVSSLLVGAAARRRHEITVRLSMGAPRSRVVRQLLTEIALLCVGGGALGLALYWLIVLKVGQFLLDVDIRPDWSSVAGSIAVALTTAVLCGLSPALHATRVELASVLKDSGANATSRSRLQRTFVVAQVALTQPLLMGLGAMVVVLFGEMTLRGRSQAGDRTLRLMYTSAVPTRDVAAGRERRRALEERIAALPGVAGVVSLSYRSSTEDLTIEGARQPFSPTKPAQVRLESIEAGHFKALGIQLTRGREFGPDDMTAAELPVIVDVETARRIWGDADPIGKHMQRPRSLRSAGKYVVVGVVDAKSTGPISVFAPTENPLFFKPNTSGFTGALMVRTRGPAEAYIPTLRSVGLGMSPALALTQARTLSEIERSRITQKLTAMGMAAAGGMLALFLGAIGLYAVVSLGVAQRTREIGIRVSLGAAPSDVVRMFFGAGLRLSTIGLAIGLPLSLSAMWLAAAEFGLKKAHIPAIAGAVMVSVMIVAALASFLPARRAAAIDPLTALRAE